MRTKFSIGYFWRIATFYVLCLIIFMGVSFAEPGVKITEPTDGTVVHPGDEIVVRIEATEGFRIEEGEVAISKFFYEEFTNLPASFTAKIPMEAIGKLHIGVMAFGEPVKFAYAEANLIVEQTATLQSLEVDPSGFSINIDWNNNIIGDYYPYINVDGVYSDGITRDLNKNVNTAYISSDPSVVSVDIDERGRAKVKVYKVGQATITVSNSGVSKVIPVVFEKPRGIRPSETIPPTTTINILPPANAAGWHNTGITITLTAQDNEGGSGVQEISYQFPYLSAKSTYVTGNQAVISFSQEGINLLRYVAYDKERNSSGQQSMEIHLDKTPPQIKISASPDILWPPNHKMVNITISGSSADALSGVSSTTFKVTDEYGKVEPKISKFGDTIQLEAWRKGDDLDGRIYTISVTATDYAGNKATATATVIVPHDVGKQ